MLNAAASLAGKQIGQQLALDMAGDWRDRVLLDLRGWLAIHKARGFTTFTMEQFRAEAKEQPASSKAWGGLAGIACRAGLIFPMTHPDGSPVMRNAEAVKTRAHPVRVWGLAASSAPAPMGARSTSQHDTGAAVAACRTLETAHVGNAASATGGILAAVQAYHHQREAR